MFKCFFAVHEDSIARFPIIQNTVRGPRPARPPKGAGGVRLSKLTLQRRAGSFSTPFRFAQPLNGLANNGEGLRFPDASKAVCSLEVIKQKGPHGDRFAYRPLQGQYRFPITHFSEKVRDMGEPFRFPDAMCAGTLLKVIQQKRPPQSGLFFARMTSRGIEPRFQP